MASNLDVDWSAFRALVVSGLSIREVARRLGVNPNTALQRASRQKWGIAELRGLPPPTTKEVLQRTERTVQAGKDFYREANGKTKLHLAKSVVSASETLSSMPGPQILENHQALAGVAKTASQVFNWDSEHPHPHLSVQGILFACSPDQLAAKDACFTQLRDQYSSSQPVRDLNP